MRKSLRLGPIVTLLTKAPGAVCRITRRTLHCSVSEFRIDVETLARAQRLVGGKRLSLGHRPGIDDPLAKTNRDCELSGFDSEGNMCQAHSNHHHEHHVHP